MYHIDSFMHGPIFFNWTKYNALYTKNMFRFCIFLQGKQDG